MTRENTLLIINPVSGRKKIKPLLYKVVDLFCKHGRKTTIFITSGPREATEIVKEHSRGCERIICCGGDGTLNEIFTGLMETKTNVPVGYIPTGTTNDFAKTHNLPRNIAKAAVAALEGHIGGIDIGIFNEGKFFSYVASFGAFTKVAYKTPQWLKNFLGRPSYFLYGVSSLKDIKPVGVKVIADGKEVQGDFIFGSVTNAVYLGGFMLFPSEFVSLNDGMFELFLIRAPKSPKDLQAITESMLKRRYILTTENIFQNSFKVFRREQPQVAPKSDFLFGAQNNDKQVLVLKAKKISFSFTEPVPWTVDGEFAGEEREVVIDNINKAIKIVTTPEAT